MSKTIKDLVEDVFDKDEFKIGDEVVFIGHKATIFGIVKKEDYGGRRYAISYVDGEGKRYNFVVTRNDLKPIKSKNELKKGDKFKCVYETSECTVMDKHEEPDDKIYYFYVNEHGYCDLCQPRDIKEVL